MRTPLKLAGAVLVLVLAWAFLFCPAQALASSPSPAPTKPIVFRIGIASDVDGMNPFGSWSAITWESFRLSYDFLTWYDDNYKPCPDLAESWSYSDNGKVWTFKIRSGLKWQDGQPLTARDIAFTYNYILKNDLWAYTSYLTHVTKVEAPDDTTVVITSSQPNPRVLGLYIPIVPEHIWKNVPGDKAENFENVPLVGSGPFQVTEMKRGKWVKLVANKDYFGGAPKIDQLYFMIYRTEAGMMQDYKAGNLDAIMNLPPNDYRILKGMPGSSVAAGEAIGLHELGFNCYDSPKSKGNPLLLDARIRQAVNWAIDKQLIVNQSMAGLATVGTSVLAPATGWHWDVPADQQYTYDPEKAKQILDDAGYMDRNGDGVREAPNGKPLDFRLAAFNEYPEDITAAKLIHQWLADVGIKTRLQIMDEGAFSSDVADNADMDMYIWSWGGDVDPGFMLSCFTKAQILNWSDCMYSNPQYEQLYLAQGSTVDPAKRRQITDQMQAILYRDSPYIVLWYNVNVQAYRTDRWTGWHLIPPGRGAPFKNLLKTTYIDLQPKTSGAAGNGGGTPLWLWIVIAVVVVLAAGFGVYRWRRPKATETG